VAEFYNAKDVRFIINGVAFEPGHVTVERQPEPARPRPPLVVTVTRYLSAEEAKPLRALFDQLTRESAILHGRNNRARRRLLKSRNASPIGARFLTLMHRVRYGGRKGRRAWARLRAFRRIYGHEN